MSSNSPIVPLPRDVASAGVNPAPNTSGDTADATSSLPAWLDSVSVTSAAPKVQRGAAIFSFEPAKGIPFVERERRIPERSPAAFVRSRTSASVFIPSKAINSRAISVAPHRGHRVGVHQIVVLPLTAPNFSGDGVGAARDRSDAENRNNNQIDNHFHHSAFSMLGVNTV